MKRVLDVVISLTLLVLFSPMMCIVAIIVRAKMGTPILFKQKRPGLHGKPFYLYKFRTMTHSLDNNGHLLPDQSRLTNTGKFLRKYSLDELPQLLNLIKGEMSLVGPRPLLMEYLPFYTKEQASRHNVKPGITGWAQVNGRNALTWEEKFILDTWYVKNHTIILDFKILRLTLSKVVKKEGINHQDDVPMEKFTGSKEVI
ncbi:sugar transferase [Peribacillus cavernae]|uniref:Sugar transferase n=1 Tax=Peribacillus cavernae TaxID=1674310 RepID=A0A433HP43_9BACI|nr:sugar transferase [Peribacillus cavernae]MDQ0217490.1 sugar transferase EpsL [Peribacillus cavernae]RUQ30069.1 sugar transferase [Peribacillus cavernae]